MNPTVRKQFWILQYWQKTSSESCTMDKKTSSESYSNDKKVQWLYGVGTLLFT